MSLALSTRWFGSTPLSGERLLAHMKLLNVKESVFSSAAPYPGSQDVARHLTPVGGRVVAVEVGDPSAKDRGGGLSSLNGEVRQGARMRVASAMQVGRAVGASLMILRLGAIESDRDFERDDEVRGLLRTGGKREEVDRIVASIARDVERRCDIALERGCRELFEVCRGAPEFRFALATPRALAGLPTAATLKSVLSEVGASNLGYWHDEAASAYQEEVGMATKGTWLGEHSGVTMGASLSDAAGADLWLPPGAGRVDFRAIREQLPAAAIGAIDVDPRFSADETRLAASYLRSVGF